MTVTFRFLPLALSLLLLGCGRPKPHEPPPFPSLDDQTKVMELQKACADQAARAFRSADYPHKPNVINTYTNHYSARLGRCFMLVSIYDSSDAQNPSTFETVEDAFEGRRLGSYFAQNAADAKAGGHAATCEERPAGAQAKTCKSKAEWDGYRARYMETP